MAEGSISRRSLLVGGAVTVAAGIAGFFKAYFNVNEILSRPPPARSSPRSRRSRSAAGSCSPRRGSC